MGCGKRSSGISMKESNSDKNEGLAGLVDLITGDRLDGLVCLYYLPDVQKRYVVSLSIPICRAFSPFIY